ncbi:MAG TPA: prolyl oligopeptidase family serine peptidase [Rhizomicrobium sp.]|jgi:dipeptidyl aminopeptidase/acylaminoacyl peptidase
MSLAYRAPAVALALAISTAPAPAKSVPPQTSSPTLEQVLSYPFVPEIASARDGNSVAWVRVVRGVRNVWVAQGPDFKPRQVTHYTADDGQEITQLTFSPDGKHLVYVRGGDHDANWPAEGDLAPDPNSAAEQPKVTIWAASLTGGAPRKVAEGDEPALSNNQLSYVAKNQVWTASLDGKGKPAQMFFDRGEDHELEWSPDGKRLAFVSQRDKDDHSFVGIFNGKNQPIEYLAPSTSRDESPRWSPDGRTIAYVRQPGRGGAPEPLLKQVPNPWTIWVADAASGKGHVVWSSPNTLLGSFPETAGEANLHWAAGNRLVFLADLDNWPHLYSIPASGGTAMLLTPGKFMVEHVDQSKDHKWMIYSANTGTTAGDYDRRHIFRVPVDKAAPQPLTAGDGLEWMPVAADATHVAFVTAGVSRPPTVALASLDGKQRHDLLDDGVVRNYPGAGFVTPKPVTFTAADGTLVHGQLFQRDAGTTTPGVIFVHGGPPRQMLLGWHYMDYYSNAYAVNQYLASRGFTVLSVNYRLGIGYGHAFHHPEHAGYAGGAEYQDVVAGAKFLQRQNGVDAKRIGIWGGSYGGYLTAMGLSHNSDIFKAGVDFHGVHDWSAFLDEWIGPAGKRYEQGDRTEALKVAFESSPDAQVAHWKSPVLLIQGDDDRNVMFHQTIDLARRLDTQGVHYEELVIPNEIHGFLRWISWLKADQATAAFLTKELIAAPPSPAPIPASGGSRRAR